MINFKKNILLISLVLLGFLFPIDFLSQVKLTHYPPSFDAGVSSANCFDIIQDNDGVIWIATEDGITKFNGKKFSFINDKNGITDNLMYDIELFKKNQILVGGRGGLDLINLAKDTIFNLVNNREISELRKIFYDEPNKEIHLFSENFFNTKFSDSIRINKYHKVLNDSTFEEVKVNHLIWEKFTFDSLTFILSRYDPRENNLSLVKNKDTITIEHKGYFVWKVFQFKDKILISTDKGIKLLNENKLEDFILNNQNISDVLIIDDDLYYVLNNNLYEFNGMHSSLLIEGKNYGGNISSIFLDREKNIWLCTGNGVVKVENTPFYHYSKSHNLLGKPTEIKRNKDMSLWVGTGSGIFSKNDTSSNFEKKIKYPVEDFEFLNENEIILHFPNIGFLKYNIAENIIEEISLKSNTLSDDVMKRINGLVKNGLVRDYHKDKNGNFWIVESSSQLILQLDDQFNLIKYFDRNPNARSYSTFDGSPMNKTLGDWLPCIYVDKQNRVWFRTDNGLSMINNGRFNFFYSQDFSPKLPGGTYMIREDALGNLVLASEQGLYKLILKNNKIKSVLRFTDVDGLTSKKIFSMEFTKDGDLMAGVSNGLNKIKEFDSIIVQQKLEIEYFSLKQGLTTSDFTLNSSYIDDDNSIWIGQPNGLLHYVPEKDIPNKISPLLYLEEIKLGNESKESWEIKSGKVNALVLEKNPIFYYNQNDITFVLNSVSFADPEGIKYDYFLEGFNVEWEQSISYPYVRYNNLKPGNYTFKARAVNKDDFKSEELIYGFTIEEPIYQKAWFIITLIVGSILLIAGIFYLRQRQLKADNLKLEHKVSIRTEQLAEEKQKVEKQNHQILQSINYAKRIQTSILPDDQLMKSFFSNHFVLYQPKDVVGGDFYWFRNFGEIAVLATVDCTGHGVPGGFMSMMGSLLLDKIVQENNLDTSKILSELNKEIIRVLKQDSDNSMQDGMDMAICVINKKEKKISFSGARNGIFIMDKNNKKYYDADLYPVGGFYSKKSREIKRVYKSNTIDLKDDSWVFMYTDGYYDQLGGERMLSLGMDLFMAHLSKAVKSSEDNVTVLKEEYNKWRGKMSPIDDVLVIGFQI